MTEKALRKRKNVSSGFDDKTILDAMKDELIAVISRYISIDPDAVRIEMTQEGREQRLIADIPLRPNQRRKSG